MKEKNGKNAKDGVKVEATFKRNVDYFELKAGTFYTLKALMAKYNCSNYHIYAKAKEFNVEKESILGQTVYKDAIKDGKPVFEKFAHVSPEFNKGTAEHLKAYRAVPFATLCANVREMKEAFDKLTLQQQITSDSLAEELDKIANTLGDILNYLTKNDKRLEKVEVEVNNINALHKLEDNMKQQLNERN